jgi:hypothetical protein
MHIGKFLFIWQFNQLESGRPVEAIIEEACELQLGMVAIKIADGASTFGASGPDAKVRFYVDELHRRGIQVWGWHYLYGGRRLLRNEQGQVIGTTENTFSTPETESNIAVQQMRALGLDGYIMDPEAEYKSAPAGRAARFMSRVRVGLGNVPIALCSYRFPQLHPELPWNEFLAQTDIHMPQVYWGEGSMRNGMTASGQLIAALDLDRSVAQLSALKSIPFLPVGRIYIGDGHSNPQPYEITGFMNRARELGFDGAGFWNWDSLRPKYSGASVRLQVLKSYQWLQSSPPEYNLFLPIFRG